MTTDPTRAAEIVVASKEARSAAADLYLAQQGEPHSPHDLATAEAIRSGLNDHWEVVQAFARFERDHMQRPTDTARAGEVERLQAVIERDRSTVCQAMNEMEVRFNHYSHLAEFGRGSYSWDDDRYVKEFGDALEHFREGMTPFRKIARDWSDCPTDPEKIKAARTTPSPVTDETALSGEAQQVLAALKQRNDLATENGCTVLLSVVQSRHIENILRAALASTPQPAGAETVNAEEMPEVAAIRYLNDLRGEYGSIITILCDDEEAWTRDKQMAIEVCSDWTEWNPRRFYGESILQCAAKAVHSRDALAAIRQSAKGGE